jgi:ABC-2 type transport system permease protein
MLALLKKEIRSFLHSLIGYIVMGVFLLITALFLWVFPDTEFNVLENGYSNIDSLFILAPWVFLFLIPAITMRSFSEEKKAGTMELLLTKPLRDFEIILSKYLAGVLLVLISLLPTLIWCLTVSMLATPAGNIDTGGMWGSYLGLFFLASGFVSIGIFASAISENQVVAFIIAVFLCFFCYTGLDSISSLGFPAGFDSIIQYLGINIHYASMSRGVLDTRDIIYFLSLVSVFMLFTKTTIEKRKW